MRSQANQKPSSLAPWLLAFLAGCLAALGVYYIDQVENRRYQQEIRSETLELLSTLRAGIEARLNSDLQLFSGLVVQISLHPDISLPQIDDTVRELMAKRELVRSIGVSEGFVVRFVHPLRGNEAAIGLNYLEQDNQREPVLRAMRSRQDVLAGPVELVQGGQALIGRLPIFTAVPHQGDAAGKFWGIVSVVLNLELLYQQVGLRAPDLGIDIAIRGSDGLGPDGAVFFGDERLFSRAAAQLDLQLPGGRWRMAAVPNQKLLSQFSDQRTMLRSMGMIVVLLVCLATLTVGRQLQQQQTIINVQAQTKEQIWHAATHDRLTGMANRFLFNEELRHSIARARRNGSTLAVLFLDLDRFKDINDSFGHRVGDLFLQSFAGKLAGQTQESQLIARLGGDEFAIIIEDVAALEEPARLAQQLTEWMNQPFQIEQNTLRAGVSIGIACFPSDGEEPDALLQNADLAMYTAKDDPLSSYAFFQQSMNHDVQLRKQLVDDIRNAFDAKQFSLAYQPIIDIQQCRMVGVEALARWHHPQRGWISPATFIPVAEKSGLIIPFGRWSLEQAMTEISAATPPLNPALTLSINLSPIQLHRGDPLTLVEQTLARTGLPATCLDIEITESAILEDVDKATEVVRSLRDRGISVTIDDFGTGYSSLSHLRHLPVNRIKIDISFVRQIGKDRKSEAIIKAILYLSRTLNLRATAEGVETEQQLDFLQSHGCTEIQGYYFAKPMAAEQLGAFADGLRHPSAPLKSDLVNP